MPPYQDLRWSPAHWTGAQDHSVRTKGIKTGKAVCMVIMDSYVLKMNSIPPKRPMAKKKAQPKGKTNGSTPEDKPWEQWAELGAMP